ncbi:hypothetical protein [Photorhabdus heterorhabditis]|uniref:hypothetical protein n=1 Tax=Photorhabdus heterorhabditis TaxID=880156 RepID=UPI0015621E45|nr:hypothetical protein [Photorhabdus heterorhabditis]NRN28495.1 hypothetical protein [Photorhabdus heterorhabditis subsp. aluminescens]
MPLWLATLTHPGHRVLYDIVLYDIVIYASWGFAPLPSRCILKSIGYMTIHLLLSVS